MSEPSLIEKVQLTIVKGVIDTGLGSLLTQNEKLYPRDHNRALIETIRDIGKIQMGKDSVAFSYLEHFLSGRGGKIELDTPVLFDQDENVRNRVIKETHRRVLQAMTTREKGVCSKPITPKFEKAIDPTISIFQDTFKNNDWRLALGSYAFEIVSLSTPQKKNSSFFVVLEGRNSYRWHENEARITQNVHRICAYLVNLGLARVFDIVSKPYMLSINPEYARILQMTTMTQSNPKEDVSTFTPAGVARAAGVSAYNQARIAAKAAKDFGIRAKSVLEDMF